MYLIFNDKKQRDMVYDTIRKYIAKTCITTENNLEHYTQVWTSGQMSNFDYLMLLNSYA